MGDTIGARLAIEGEREFKQALQNADAQLKALSSSLDLSAAKFAGQENSMEALSARYSVLEKQYDTQAKKVDLIRQRLEQSAKEYGENSNQTLYWQTALNRAETQLEKIRKKLQDTGGSLEAYDNGMEEAKDETNGFSEKIKEIDKGFVGLGDALDKITEKFGISLPKGIQDTLNKYVEIDVGTVALAGGIAALAASIVKAEKALISFTKESAEYAMQLNVLSSATGLTIDAAQEWDYVFRTIGSSLEEAQGDLSALQEKMNDAKDETSEAGQIFADMGVSVKNADGTLRSVGDVLPDIITALSQMDDTTRRNALSSELMSTTGEKLTAIYDQEEGTLEKLIETKRKNGVMTQQDLEDLESLNAATLNYQDAVDSLKNKLASEFAPYLEESTEDLTSFVGNLGTSLKQSGIVDAFGMLLNTFSGMLTPADQLAKDKVPALTQALRPLAQVLAGISSTVELLASIMDIRTLLTKPGDYVERLYTATGIGYQYGYKNQYQQLLDMYAGTDTNYRTDANGYGQYYANGKYYANKDAYLRELYAQSGYGGTFEAWKIANGYNASGNHNWRGGYSWVGENGPELVSLPRGSSILSAQESREAVGDTYVTVTIDAKNVKEFNDIVRIAQEARMKGRKG